MLFVFKKFYEKSETIHLLITQNIFFHVFYVHLRMK